MNLQNDYLVVSRYIIYCWYIVFCKFLSLWRKARGSVFSSPDKMCFLDALPDEHGEVSAEVHVEEGALDVVDLQAEGLSHHHVVGAPQLAI